MKDRKSGRAAAIGCIWRRTLDYENMKTGRGWLDGKVLYSFQTGAQALTIGGLILAQSGNLYGAVDNGGSGGGGAVRADALRWQLDI